MPVSAKIGCTLQTLNDWVKKEEVDSGRRAPGRRPSGPRSGVSSKTTGASMAFARSGGSCAVKALISRVALMKSTGLQGVIRAKPRRSTIPDKKAPCPLDKVNRQFRVRVPNMLWVSAFTYIRTWKGFVSFGPCARTDGDHALTFRP